MSDIANLIMQEFVFKQYADVPLDILGGVCIGRKLLCWINPPHYADKLGELGFNDLKIFRWVTENYFFEERDSAKAFTQEQVNQMPDEVIAFFFNQFNDARETYQKKFPLPSKNFNLPATT